MEQPCANDKMVRKMAGRLCHAMLSLPERGTRDSLSAHVSSLVAIADNEDLPANMLGGVSVLAGDVPDVGGPYNSSS